MRNDEKHTKGEKIAAAIAIATAAFLIGQAAATGEPILQPDCHGASKATCAQASRPTAGENTKAGYAHRGIVTSPANDDDLQQQDARY